MLLSSRFPNPPSVCQIALVDFHSSAILTCLGFAYLFKKISCSWISHVTVDKVLYSSGRVEHLLLYSRLAAYRWKHCESLAFFFFFFFHV